MELIQALYVIFSGTLALAGLSVVGLALRAYYQTNRMAMLHLSIGFVLIVGAAMSTTISAFLLEFSDATSLLTVNYGITTLGYVFVIYSILPRS